MKNFLPLCYRLLTPSQIAAGLSKTKKKNIPKGNNSVAIKTIMTPKTHLEGALRLFLPLGTRRPESRSADRHN